MRRRFSLFRALHEGSSLAGNDIVVGFMERTLDEAIAEFGERAVTATEDPAVGQAYERVVEVRRVLRAAQGLGRASTPAQGVPLYLVGAGFLRSTFEALTKTPDEHLVYATGPEDGKEAFALSQLVTFELAETSAVSAAPDPASQLEALTELDRRGERLLAVLHSHPGYGADATGPSTKDWATQQGLERMGYPTIGAIFSRDGFVHFFSVNRKFRVAVSGTGVERTGEQVYHLTAVAPKSSPRRVVSHASAA